MPTEAASTLAPMATFNRDDAGVWTVTLEPGDSPERNPVFDATVPRYLTLFDPAFLKAEKEDEAEFIKALLRVGPLQDAGWDPYATTLRAVPDIQKLHALIPKGDEWYETSRHLALWTYGHVVEAAEPYAMLADILDVAGGGQYVVPGFRFPDVPTKYGTRPQRRDEKMAELRRLAEAAELLNALVPLDEVWDRELRNAVFHADYSIHGSETRIPALSKTYSHEEIETLVNRALAYHEALAFLRRAYRGAYEEPTQIPVRWRRPKKGGEEGEYEIEEDVGVVMVREGVGAIGLKHAHTAEEIERGAIAWSMAVLYPDESDALRDDPTLAKFPVRADG
jgi:hypothetical protein